jgi:ubiquitin-protein ligase E3 C
MIPIFGDERRRKMNLGGASSASSHAAILDQAKARRSERHDLRRRQENVVKLQAWWRGLKEARMVRSELKKAFEEDVTGITGLRCLVLTGRDEEVLGRWSSAMISSGEGTFFDLT